MKLGRWFSAAPLTDRDQTMKLMLNCFYGDHSPGQIIDEKDEVQAKSLINNGAAKAVVAEATAEPATATKPAKSK